VVEIIVSGETRQDAGLDDQVVNSLHVMHIA
jgi:hypothetical protein